MDLPGRRRPHRGERRHPDAQRRCAGQAQNICWQVAGATTLGTTAGFKGIILGQTLIALNTGATVTGRLLAQTAVTLDASAVINP